MRLGGERGRDIVQECGPNMRCCACTGWGQRRRRRRKAPRDDHNFVCRVPPGRSATPLTQGQNSSCIDCKAAKARTSTVQTGALSSEPGGLIAGVSS